MSVQIFIRMMTQWRTTMGGVTGLDYSVLQMLFDLYDISNRKEVFEEIQIMEREGMRIYNKEKK